MAKFTRVATIVAISSVVFATSSTYCRTQPPVRTLNFDFGSGPAYVGDDGVLSSPGGTFWNRVTAEELNNPPHGTLGALVSLDEFGASSAGRLGSRPRNLMSSPKTLGWINTRPIVAGSTFGDGIGPGRDNGAFLGVFDNAMVSLSSIQDFHEMVLYFVADLSDSSLPADVPAGGFSTNYAPDLFGTDGLYSVPFSGFSLQASTLGGGPTEPLATFSYIHVTQPPVVQERFEMGKLISLAFPDFNLGSVAISAIQIRGTFAIPEPSCVSLFLIATAYSMARRCANLANNAYSPC